MGVGVNGICPYADGAVPDDALGRFLEPVIRNTAGRAHRILTHLRARTTMRALAMSLGGSLGDA